MQQEQIFTVMRLDIVPLAICFILGGFAGWCSHMFCVYFKNREKEHKAQIPE